MYKESRWISHSDENTTRNVRKVIFGFYHSDQELAQKGQGGALKTPGSALIFAIQPSGVKVVIERA